MRNWMLGLTAAMVLAPTVSSATCWEDVGGGWYPAPWWDEADCLEESNFGSVTEWRDDSPVSNNGTGRLTAGAGAEATSISSTIDTAIQAVEVLDFAIKEGSGAIGPQLDIPELSLNVGGSAANLASQITWELNGPDAMSVTGTVSSGKVTFSGLSILVSYGPSETYTISAYFNNNTGLTDGATFDLSIDGDTDVIVVSRATFGDTSPITNSVTIDVDATKLAFTTQPAGSVSGSTLTTQPVVKAQDAFGNTDVDFTDTVTLTEASAGTLTGDLDVAAVAGVGTFTDLVYTATADQQSFVLTVDDQDGVGTNLPTESANSITSDVVATALECLTSAPLGQI